MATIIAYLRDFLETHIYENISDCQYRLELD